MTTNKKMRDSLLLLSRLALLVVLSLMLTEARRPVEPLDFAATMLIDYVPDLPDTVKAGFCWSHSQVVPSSNTWRCGGEDRVVYDPCFLIQDPEIVVCGADPARGQSGFALDLTRPLPGMTLAGQTDPRPPWLVELADGALCTPMSGATLSFGDARLRYECDNGTYILGDLQPDAVWRAEQMALVRTSAGFVADHQHMEAVRRIWRVAGPITPLREEALQNAVYHLDEIQVKLSGGEYRQRFEEGASLRLTVTLLEQRAFGDLNQDGVEDVVVLLAQSGGAGGELIYAAAVLNLEGKPYNVATQPLGDRVEVHTLQVADDGRITVDFRNIGPGDAACCGSQVVRKVFALAHDDANTTPAHRLVELSAEVLVPSYLARLQNGVYEIPGFSEPVVLAAGSFTGTVNTTVGTEKITATLASHSSFNGDPEVIRTLGALSDEPDAQLALATVLMVDSGMAPPVYYPVLLLEDDRHQLYQHAIGPPVADLRVRSVSIEGGRVELRAETFGPGDTPGLATEQVTYVYGVHGNRLVQEDREVVVESIRQRLQAATFKVSGDVDGDGDAEIAALLANSVDGDTATYELVVLDEQAEQLLSTFLGFVNPDSLQVEAGMLIVEMDELGSGDEPCCPSRRVRAQFAVEQEALIERGTQILLPSYEERLKQGTFMAQGLDTPIQLHEGRFAGEVTVAGVPTRLSVSLVSPDRDPMRSVLFATGDLNNDAVDEASVILVVDRADGSAVYELAVVRFQEGQPQALASVSLGENLRVQSLAMAGRQIVLELIQYRGPLRQEATTWTYQLEGNHLRQVKK